MNQNRINESFTVINNLATTRKYSTTDGDVYDFVIASCLYFLSNTLAQSNGKIDLQGIKCIPFTEALNVYLRTINSEYTKNYYIFNNTPFEDIDTYNSKYYLTQSL